MDQTHVVNDIKEATTFVSLDFRRDLDLCKWVDLSSVLDTSRSLGF